MRSLGRPSVYLCLARHKELSSASRAGEWGRTPLRPLLTTWATSRVRRQQHAACRASQVANSSGRTSQVATTPDPEQAFQEISSPAPENRLALLKRIAAFAGPALSIPLADPLMSLIDTISIGQVNQRRCRAAQFKSAQHRLTIITMFAVGSWMRPTRAVQASLQVPQASRCMDSFPFGKLAI